MSLFRRREREVPVLNTSSLPDLIFTILFFFMIVTHMRKVTLKVQYQVPQGKELTRLTKKSAVSYIYIGKCAASDSSSIQLNDKMASVADVQDYITAERQRMAPEDLQRMTVSVKADLHTRMGIITDVKQALRQAKAFRINYSAIEKGK